MESRPNNSDKDTTDWEAILAGEGLPEDIDNDKEVPSGDALSILSPEEARERAEQAGREDHGDSDYDNA